MLKNPFGPGDISGMESRTAPAQFLFYNNYCTVHGRPRVTQMLSEIQIGFKMVTRAFRVAPTHSGLGHIVSGQCRVMGSAFRRGYSTVPRNSKQCTLPRTAMTRGRSF
jgi:hypothetical protein